MPLSLRLVYLGNLGLAHDVPLLCDFLKKCRGLGEVDLTFVGTTEKSLHDVRDFARDAGIRIELHPHIDFTRLREVLQPMGFDFGLVTLAEEFRGLLSPSKFAGYLEARLPIIYLGPADTNVGLVCDRFGAGLRMDRASLCSGDPAERVAAFHRQAERARFLAGVDAAADYFRQFDGTYLAREILGRSPASASH